jgi:hypothetical protein
MHKVGDENLDQNAGNGAAQSLPNAHLKDAVDITCESCNCNVFEEKIMLKKLSKFITGSDRDSVTPIPVIACAKCNHVNEMFIPKF